MSEIGVSACCSHMTVRHQPIEHPEGGYSSRWLCLDCNHPFTPLEQTSMDYEAHAKQHAAAGMVGGGIAAQDTRQAANRCGAAPSAPPADKPRIESAAAHLDYLAQDINALALQAHANVDRLGGAIPTEAGPREGTNPNSLNVPQIARIEHRLQALDHTSQILRSLVRRLEAL